MRKTRETQQSREAKGPAAGTGCLRRLGHDAPAATSDGLGESRGALAAELGGEAAQECGTAALQVLFPITERPSASYHASIPEAPSSRSSLIDVPSSEERAKRKAEPLSRSF
jgi:hypothetical protein